MWNNDGTPLAPPGTDGSSSAIPASSNRRNPRTEESGFGFTADTQQCKETLSKIAPLNEATISRFLGKVACTCPTPRSLNVDILVETIKLLAPGTSWKKVMENLDYDGFDIPNMESFMFLMRLYKTACQEAFPLDAVCGCVWKNREGQISFLKHAISAPPEVFTFKHSPRKLVIDNMHSDEQQELRLSNHAWLSLDLLDVLCRLTDSDHECLISSLLDYPLAHCPRTLLLGMAHMNATLHHIQQMVGSALFPVIIANTQESGFLLDLVHQNEELFLRWLFDAACLKEDRMLRRIVEICHELKFLYVVLDSFPDALSIPLAVLASLKGYVDIGKCLDIFGNSFAEECLKFAKNVHLRGSENLDAACSLLKALKRHEKAIHSYQLVKEIEKVRCMIQNGEDKESPASNLEFGHDDVRAEAKAYLRKMLDGVLSVDAIVEMLSRYKVSLVLREKLVFEFMIGIMFNQYWFFPEYPEKQLKTASVLFGSVIKHQLIKYRTLTRALGRVLDSLREPADSKMFLFGSTALEQFVNGLAEFPNYCNQILQISSLRRTHPELVTIIKQAHPQISGNLAPLWRLGPSQSFKTALRLAHSDLILLPTGPRERSFSKLGGGFRSYGSNLYGEDSSDGFRDRDSGPSKKPIGGGADSDTLGRREESNGGGENFSGGSMPRLVLQPRSLPVPVVEKPVTVERRRGVNPFGNARPREEVLAEKGQDWREIEEKLEAVKLKEVAAAIEKVDGRSPNIGFGLGRKETMIVKAWSNLRK